MNRKWFGDSYDIVKRFFIEELTKAGYHVVVIPMFTGERNGLEDKYYIFIKAEPADKQSDQKRALFLDPGTGVGSKRTKKHITIECITKQLLKYDVVFSFDQSFSRTKDDVKKAKAREKLKLLRNKSENCGFYYYSHACFLFSAKSDEILKKVEQQLLSSGLPASRLLKECVLDKIKH